MAILALSAGWASATPQDFAELEIRQVITGRLSEGVYLVTNNESRSFDSCGPAFFVEASNPLLNQNVALAMAAMYAKSRVEIHVDGCFDAAAMKVRGIRVAR